MKGKIDNEGNFLVLRNHMFLKQTCPYSLKFCGDNCPLFYEERTGMGSKKSLYVTNCKSYTFHVVEDDRRY